MATHGKARTSTIRALGNREPFKRNGFNMRGESGATFLKGYLPDAYWEQYSTLASNGMITYTVLSYNTPIAWVTVSGTVVIPDVSYSATTTHHQSLCKVYL